MGKACGELAVCYLRHRRSRGTITAPSGPALSKGSLMMVVGLCDGISRVATSEPQEGVRRAVVCVV